MFRQDDATAAIVVSDPREFTATGKWNNVAIDQHHANSSCNQHVDHDSIHFHLVARQLGGIIENAIDSQIDQRLCSGTCAVLERLFIGKAFQNQRRIAARRQVRQSLMNQAFDVRQVPRPIRPTARRMPSPDAPWREQAREHRCPSHADDGSAPATPSLAMPEKLSSATRRNAASTGVLSATLRPATVHRYRSERGGIRRFASNEASLDRSCQTQQAFP